MKQANYEDKISETLEHITPGNLHQTKEFNFWEFYGRNNDRIGSFVERLLPQINQLPKNPTKQHKLIVINS
jgi:hypothetical protein